MSELRVLMLTPGYAPVLGGGETHARLLSEALVRRGHSVVVLTHGYGAPERESLNGVEVLRTRSGVHWRSGTDRVEWEELLFGLLAEAARLLDGRQFDVIHGQCQAGLLLGSMLRPGAAQALVATLHETEPETDPMGSSRTAFIYRDLCVDAIVAGSDAFLAQALQYGAPPERIHKVYMGIDIDRWRPPAPPDLGAREAMRHRLSVPATAPLALLVGRFKPRKGILEFIEAVALARADYPNLHAAIVGSGHSASTAYKENMLGAIERAGISAAVIVAEDAFSDAEMVPLLHCADIVVQPSYREGLGLAAIEALAAGRPVIAASVPGLTEVIRDGLEGLMVPPRDPGALAGAIRRMLGAPELAARLARQGRTRVEALFSIERTAYETEQIYMEVLSKRQRGTPQRLDKSG